MIRLTITFSFFVDFVYRMLSSKMCWKSFTTTRMIIRITQNVMSKSFRHDIFVIWFVNYAIIWNIVRNVKLIESNVIRRTIRYNLFCRQLFLFTHSISISFLRYLYHTLNNLTSLCRLHASSRNELSLCWAKIFERFLNEIQLYWISLTLTIEKYLKCWYLIEIENSWKIFDERFSYVLM